MHLHAEPELQRARLVHVHGERRRAQTDTGTVTINVTAVNDAPVATDVPDAETDEDVTSASTLDGHRHRRGDTVTVDHGHRPGQRHRANVDGPIT